MEDKSRGIYFRWSVLTALGRAYKKKGKNTRWEVLSCGLHIQWMAETHTILDFKQKKHQVKENGCIQWRKKKSELDKNEVSEKYMYSVTTFKPCAHRRDLRANWLENTLALPSRGPV